MVKDAVGQGAGLRRTDGMHIDPRRFARHQEVLVLVEEAEGDRFRNQIGPFEGTNGDAQTISRLHPALQPGHPAVEPDPAAAGEAIDHPPGKGEGAHQDLLHLFSVPIRGDTIGNPFAVTEWIFRHLITRGPKMISELHRRLVPCAFGRGADGNGPHDVQLFVPSALPRFSAFFFMMEK